eukprot:2817156-Rhodomonas_salina.3
MPTEDAMRLAPLGVLGSSRQLCNTVTKKSGACMMGRYSIATKCWRHACTCLPHCATGRNRSHSP